ncbi:MAG: transketolase [Clostridia bacterium]
MKNIDKLTIDTLRALVADTVERAKSGHPGMAIGSAPIGYAIFKSMNHNPKNSAFLGRDRFVLSAGHASALYYSLLHVFGYDVSMDDMKNFRQLGSKTPGHPEHGVTDGVEVSTGPLGQGFSMAIGMAIAEERLAAEFNTDKYKIFNNYTYVLMGDGCMMEGATAEAASLAGSLKLGKLIVVYDSNHITIEGDTSLTFTENVAARFAAYGFQIIEVTDGEDLDSIESALCFARAEKRKPTLIIVHTEIAKGTLKEGMRVAHGEPLGAQCIEDMKARMEFSFPPFTVPEEVYDNVAMLQKKFDTITDEYATAFASYAIEHKDLKRKLDEWKNINIDPSIFSELETDKNEATRSSSSVILNKLFEIYPNLIGGSADLAPSNKCEIKSADYFSAENRKGSNIHFGVRELAMAAVCNGISLYGYLRPFCATFMVFSDYLKPALRLSALMHLPVIYILTHDSIGVGEDGPTHHPIEQLSSLRAIPNVNVFRPADRKETVYAYVAAMNANSPTALVLSRQNLQQFSETSAKALRGGYVLRDAKGVPDVILMASGSEVELIYKAADILAVQGLSVRLVSMPCMELFDAQDADYRESVLPGNIKRRIAVEAGSSMPWYKYIGLDGKTVTIDCFSKSAPADILFKEFGFTPENIVKKVID